MSIGSSETALSMPGLDPLRIKGSTLLGMPPCFGSRQPHEMGQISADHRFILINDASTVVNTLLDSGELACSRCRPMRI